MSAPVLSPLQCRRLLLASQGLCEDPTRAAGVDTLYDTIERLGFVQIDSIDVVARAHHLTLFSRLERYDPKHLTHLLETDRRLFEHWTHDASVIPTSWFRYWRHRFKRHEGRRQNAWWHERLGPDPHQVMDEVLTRIAQQGPLRSSDFERPPGVKSDPWWSWKPHKAALEHLWRCGKLAVVGRHNFQKIYDLTERVLPHAVGQPAVTEKAYLAWRCESALERLGVATPRELSAFWGLANQGDAKAWCERAVKQGRAVAVDAGGRDAVAVCDWPERLSATAPRRARVLCPFDPIVRDRDRLERWFGFAYRFEAFVPAKDRQYGYYVLPVLDGEDMVARLDAKLHRSEKQLQVNGFWWEAGLKVTPARRQRVQEAVYRLARFLGAAEVTGFA